MDLGPLTLVVVVDVKKFRGTNTYTVFDSPSSLRGMGLLAHLTNEETKAHWGVMTCPRPHRGSGRAWRKPVPLWAGSLRTSACLSSPWTVTPGTGPICKGLSLLPGSITQGAVPRVPGVLTASLAAASVRKPRQEKPRSHSSPLSVSKGL